MLYSTFKIIVNRAKGVKKELSKRAFAFITAHVQSWNFRISVETLEIAFFFLFKGVSKEVR